MFVYQTSSIWKHLVTAIHCHSQSSVFILHPACHLHFLPNGTPLQYSCLENPMDGGPWWATVHGVAKSRTRLSDFNFTFHFHALEKEMATHSSVLAWRIPGTEEPGGLPSMGLHRVGHDWSDLAEAAAAAFILTLSSNMPLLSFFTELTKPKISLESLYWQKNPSFEFWGFIFGSYYMSRSVDQL